MDLVRLSMLRNLPIVLGERQIGLCQGACFDRARKRVCALIVSSGMRGKRIVPSASVRMITPEFILVDGWCKYRQSNKQQLWPFIRDASGILAGRVTDYAVDEQTLRVFALEVIPGYFSAERKNRIWFYAHSAEEDDDGELHVPAFLCSQPCSSREGNEL